MRTIAMLQGMSHIVKRFDYCFFVVANLNVIFQFQFQRQQYVVWYEAAIGWEHQFIVLNEPVDLKSQFKSILF